jgi:hypothetical protein
MEVVALMGLLSVGYFLTKKKTEETTEGFDDTGADSQSQGPMQTQGQVQPQLPSAALAPSLFPKPLYPENTTPAGGVTVPGRPRQVRMMPDDELDLYYTLPSSSKPISAVAVAAASVF